MNFEASLLPVLGGYWLLTHLVPTRTESLRRSGYHIAFQSAVVGVVLLGAAYLTLLGVEEWCGWLKADFENAAMVSAGVGLLAPHVLNRFFDQGKWEERVAARYGDLVELLIAEAIKRSRLLEVSLKSGKSYIGFYRREYDKQVARGRPRAAAGLERLSSPGHAGSSDHNSLRAGDAGPFHGEVR